jgi:heterotetrameric sarcosine oxidase alpha subunit
MTREVARLASGGLIDRSRPVAFSFDGSPYWGYAGDTLASALLASGLRVLGRSFKYHRPRGVLTAGPEEPNALMELRTGSRREPNTRATTTELYEGLVARSQNRWPSLSFDLGALNSWFSPVFVAGFYYKTFMWPAKFWERVYEPLIRRAAGLGRAAFAPDPDTYEKVSAFCDVLIIGGGPAGLAAALSAGRSGARVILCDDDFRLGGRLNSERSEIGGLSGPEWARSVEAELSSMPEVHVLKRTSAFGLFDGNTYGCYERVSDHEVAPRDHQPRGRLWKIVAKRSVLATGAIERSLAFGNNDRPGVMLASAVRTYLNRFAVVVGKEVPVFTTCDHGWQTALDLTRAGVAVPVVIDTRSEVSEDLMEPVRRSGTRILLGAQVVGVRGAQEVRHIAIRDRGGRIESVVADALAISGGWSPNIALTAHLGGRPEWDTERAAFMPEELPRGMAVAGAARAAYSRAAALRDGVEAGAAAARHVGFNAGSIPIPSADDEPTVGAAFWYVPGSIGKAFVDFQNDVSDEDVALAAREGYTVPELLKRYTTLGMGTDQGKTSGAAGLSILAKCVGRSIAELGTTTFRAPYSPVPIGALAGHHRGADFRPTRLTSTHAWALERGATFVEAGQWLRAQWYARPGEADWRETVAREVLGVRRSVGVCDVSTLGKIDVQGPDSGTFLDRVYINRFSSLAPGKVRYGLMLREDGFALDDGTVARFSPEHFVLSTTTANASKVMQHLEHARQVLWPELDVQLTSVTEQWTQLSIAGPNSRRLLESLLDGAVDVSNQAFPYMACVQFIWRGLRARLFRISFSGELAYELAVPARYGDALIRAVMEAGAPWGLVPYGTEALSVMRIEKGHAAGNELNGTTTPHDLGLGRMVADGKDFIGRVLGKREGMTRKDRPVLIGFKPVDRTQRLRAGAHLLLVGSPASAEHDQGHLTSAAYSPTLEHWIALGFLVAGTSRIGEQVRALDALRGEEVIVEVSSPVFFDPDGSRLRA